MIVASPPGLAVARLDATAWERLAHAPAGSGAGALLGGLVYGGEATDCRPQSLARAGAVRARVLSPGGARIDAWLATGPVVEGCSGHLAWRHDGRWLFGVIELDEADEGGLEALARTAYDEVFATLAETGFANLLRLWNYLPRINADDGGLERYRQFNAGRQAAFLAAGQAAFEGAPAACAIGTPGGPFCVRFLAGRQAPIALENPRQVSAYRYPPAYGPRAPTFSRAALVQSGEDEVALLVSGTASIVGHETLHPGDARAQTRETLANVRALLGVARERSSARFEMGELECVVYVRRARDAAEIRSELEDALGADCRALRSAVMLEADICRSELLVEIEAHGFAPGRTGRA